MRKIFFASVLVLSFFLLSSCDVQAAPEKENSLLVATWNVQNLFNAVSDGNEYEEYRPSSGWTQSAYEKRLSNAGKVLAYLPDAGDYVIVLNEVECSDVVEDLIKTADIANMGLHWFACTDSAESAVQIAAVSSLPILHARTHYVAESLRPVLEVCIETERGPVFILAVHFKSNIGGTEETSDLRRQAASVASEVARNIEAENPGSLVLICGDMNEECWDERNLARDGVLGTSSIFERGLWYCFWRDTDRGIWPNGSYYYNGSWKCYDNILVSPSGKDGAGWELDDFGLVFEGILKTADSRPFAWNRSLLCGVSDHLPVWVIFR